MMRSGERAETVATWPCLPTSSTSHARKDAAKYSRRVPGTIGKTVGLSRNGRSMERARSTHRGNALTNRLARLAQEYFRCRVLPGSAPLGGVFATPSEVQSQVSARSIREPIGNGGRLRSLWPPWPWAWCGIGGAPPRRSAGGIRRHLGRDGWLRLLVFFTSASVFLVGLAVVGFRDWLPVPPGVVLRLQPAVVWVMIVAALNMPCVFGVQTRMNSMVTLAACQPGLPGHGSFLRDFIVGCLVMLGPYALFSW